jgi:NAD dependent epimerase/dehydratase family
VIAYARRIVVTGGAGFLGSHLCDRLVASGSEVICVDSLLRARRATSLICLAMSQKFHRELMWHMPMVLVMQAAEKGNRRACYGHSVECNRRTIHPIQPTFPQSRCIRNEWRIWRSAAVAQHGCAHRRGRRDGRQALRSRACCVDCCWNQPQYGPPQPRSSSQCSAVSVDGQSISKQRASCASKFRAIRRTPPGHQDRCFCAE